MEFSAGFFGLFLLLFLFFYQVEKTRCENLIFHGPCPQKWQRYSGSCYKRFTKPEVTWNDARASCQQLGSDLVIIQSQEEQNFVFETYSCGESIWIGLVNVSRDYTWVNGDKLVYTHWSGGSPGSPGKEHCVEIVDYHGSRGLWNDNSCHAKNRNYVCERGVQRGAFYRVVPETSLDGHVMSRYSTYSEIECAMKCESTTGCASANFKSSGFSDQGSDKGICELNAVSIRDVSNIAVCKPDVVYLVMTHEQEIPDKPLFLFSL